MYDVPHLGHLPFIVYPNNLHYVYQFDDFMTYHISPITIRHYIYSWMISLLSSPFELDLHPSNRITHIALIS